MAFVGKGITFDSGGISLKPGAVECTPFVDQAFRSTNSFLSGDEVDAWRYGYVISRWTRPGFNPFLLTSQTGGAATVVASALAIAQLQLPINLIVATPLTENLPGPSATKPGDMYVQTITEKGTPNNFHSIYAMNGKSVEVDNTDAEGRLVLSGTCLPGYTCMVF